MLQVVWFKRDLRITDHWPLVRAAKAGPVLPLYVFEPALMMAPDYSKQHFEFVHECLRCLQDRLRGLSVELSIEHSPMLEVLEKIKKQVGNFELLSHEETGNLLSYERDRAVARWCHSHGVAWQQFANNAVVRRLPTRNIWSAKWVETMSEKVLDEPSHIQGCEAGLVASHWPDQMQSATYKHVIDQAKLRADDHSARQLGGTKPAHTLLESFLEGRGAQ
jgi:deoxyribodipyrimidine photo-lyase